ncbi:AAEL006825-PA [Aedes aegypti]|uniref:AAEL006825-PA n=1 Tax=Aedes aegypti TaxID=7159 RepID=Q174Q6_AEDAE|nr:AAEL006825-PA [Aedes aegypti]
MNRSLSYNRREFTFCTIVKKKSAINSLPSLRISAPANAKTLDSSSGYWAESLPAMETPLCAVVDPVRDFRWHALRCGGPETAAFLCELPVPTWATDCTVTSMPSLTVQYMSDSGAVQLARDCGEQGTRHMSCQSKLERDTILQQLQCSDQETDPAQVATENNQLPEVEAAAPQQPVRTPPPQILEHDILTVVSNNDEDNNIDVNPNQIEDTVKNVINKFNLADLMQNDQSLHSGEMDGHYDGQDKEGKKIGGKKYSPLFEKKEKYGNKGERKADEEEEMMMGDQPDETETQPIDIVQQAVKPTEGESDESSTSGVIGSSTGGLAISSEVATAESTTVDSRLRRATDGEAAESTAASTTVEDSTTTVTTTTMEPTTSSTTSHILPTTPKKEISAIGDHFIPPMLLVKARFTSTRAHVDATSTTEILTEAPETTPSSTVAPTSSTSEEVTTAILTEETYAVSDNGSDIQILELDVRTSPPETSTSSESDASTTHQVVEIKFDDKEMTSKLGTLSITTRPFTADELQSSTVAENTTGTPTTASSTVVLSTTTTTTTTAAPSTTANVVRSSTVSPSTTTPNPTTVHVIEHELQHALEPEPVDTLDGDDHETNEADHQHKDLHNSFSNIENFQPYKPNRHRSLTKPEVHNNHGNYIKKILG